MMGRLILAVLLLMGTMPAHAGVGGAFSQGRAQFSLVAGNAYAFDYRYFVVGGNASYYLADGLGVGLSLENWSGDGPGINKYAPFAQYVFHQVPVLQPYLGVFYRHTDIEGLPGIRSSGGRVGVLWATGAHTYLSLGVVHETYQDCTETVYRVCSETNPDLTLIFSF